MSSIKSVLFDLDGTLLNTSSGVFSSLVKMVSELGLEPVPEGIKETFIGPPIKNSMMRVYGMADDEAKAAQDVFRRIYTTEGDLFLAEEYEGMHEALSALKKKYRLGVATYKREDMAVDLLTKYDLAKYFDVIHGSNQDSTLTKSDIINLCIKDLGASASETLMVGDSDNDCIGARGAGAKFVGVTYGFGFKKNNISDEYLNEMFVDTPVELIEAADKF